MNDKIKKLEEKQAELERQKKEIKAKIRLIRAREKKEQRKKETHYKLLLGAFFLKEIRKSGFDFQDKVNFKNYLNDDDKYQKVLDFIENK